MSEIVYNPTIGDTVISVLQAALPENYFKAYYYGDPGDIPVSLMPCVIVSKQKTENDEDSPTGLDKLIYTVKIALVYNKRNDFGKSPEEVVGKRQMEQFVEGRKTDGQYYERSLFGIFRPGYTFGNVIVYQKLEVDYQDEFVPRSKEVITAEAIITAIFYEFVPVPTRT